MVSTTNKTRKTEDICFAKLISERLILRNLSPSDLNAVLAYAGCEEATRFLPFGPLSASDVKKFITKAIKDNKTPGGNITWAVCLKSTSQCIGVFRIEHGVMIGYYYSRPFWGKGYATEALKVVVEHVKTTSEIDVLGSYVAVGNESSAQVLINAGFKVGGSVDDSQFVKNGVALPSVLYIQHLLAI